MGKEMYFGSKAVLRGPTSHPEVRTLDVVKKVLDLLYFQGWMVLGTRLEVYENEVFEFYVNVNVLEDNVSTSFVDGVESIFDNVRLHENFHIPTDGLGEYMWTKDENCLLTSKYTQGRVFARPRKGGKCHEASFKDMGIANALEKQRTYWLAFSYDKTHATRD
ncbi:hypothetical protein KY290_010774 [Solanum tuberosum]|uniref:Uncharacterized protein n=1 Tax=Solanum tuberosum TaxID=4113 RepID=A0ABQ7VYQ4_SOLTU|nr:hypothetical protein KY290_010774 [Solanum tuberosum]